MYLFSRALSALAALVLAVCALTVNPLFSIGALFCVFYTLGAVTSLSRIFTLERKRFKREGRSWKPRFFIVGPLSYRVAVKFDLPLRMKVLLHDSLASSPEVSFSFSRAELREIALHSTQNASPPFLEHLKEVLLELARQQPLDVCLSMYATAPLERVASDLFHTRLQSSEFSFDLVSSQEVFEALAADINRNTFLGRFNPESIDGKILLFFHDCGVDLSYCSLEHVRKSVKFMRTQTVDGSFSSEFKEICTTLLSDAKLWRTVPVDLLETAALLASRP